MLNQTIERGFAAWGRTMYRHPYVAILVTLVLTGFVASFARDLRVDNSTQSFLHPDDPARIQYERFREEFGQDDFVMVAVRGARVFDFAFLERLRSLHEDIEASVPHLDEVVSLINARSTRGEGDELIVEDLFETWPTDDDSLAVLEKRARQTPAYQNVLLSRQLGLTTLTVRPAVYAPELEADDVLAGFDEDPSTQAPIGRFLTEVEMNELVEELLEVMARHERPDFALSIAGPAFTNLRLTQTLEHDVKFFVGGSVLAMAFLLLLLFRRGSGVVLPLVVVLLSLVATLGAMVMLDIPGSITLQILPSLLLTVGICDAVHILTIAYRERSLGASREEAVSRALGHSGLAVLMTSLTTAAGLVSFVSAELAPVSHLGIVAPIGIVLAFLYTVVLLPALLALVPFGAERDSTRATEIELGHFLARIGAMATRHPWRVLGLTAAAACLAFGGIVKVRFAQNALEWFPYGDPVRVSQELIDYSLGGTTTLEVVVDAKRPNAFQEPEMLRRLDRATAIAAGFEHGDIRVGKVVSVVDVVKETHRALNENQLEHYAIPDHSTLVAQEFLLFENSGSDDLWKLTDRQYSKARLSLRVPLEDAILYQEFLERLRVELEKTFGPDVHLEMTGLMQLLTRTFAGVVQSMAESYAMALLVITPLMILLIGDARNGLVSMVPNLLPVFLTLGLMGWFEIPIDMSTMLIGGIIIGLAVDDTIHFMHKFQGYFSQTGDVREAVERTLETTGAALLFTTLILGSGFVVVEFAYMRNAAQFGQLACFATVTAFLADILVAPALLAVIRGGRTQQSADA